VRRGLPLLALAVLLGLAAPFGYEAIVSREADTSALRKPDVRYEPTPHKVVRQMLELARVGPSDLVYDLGSGDGRIPIAAARDFGARGVGIDIDPKRIREANANAVKAGVTDRVSFRQEDILQAKWSDATVVTLFLSPQVNARLQPRLLLELRPGTRVVSYWHDMPDWPAEKVVPAGEDRIYLWTIGPRPSL
jgi:SAM-dependent methyltransferase